MARIATPGLAVGIAVLMWLPTDEGISAGGPAETINRARQLLLAPNPSCEQLTSGFLALLDAAVEAATAGELPAEVRAQLAAARERFGRSSVTDEQGALALARCHRLLSSGQAFALPDDLRSIDDARQHIGRLLDSARTLLLESQTKAGVRALVEAAITIVTPMTAPLEAAAPIRVHLGAPPR